MYVEECMEIKSGEGGSLSTYMLLPWYLSIAFPTPLHLSNRPFYRVRPLSFPKQAQPLIQWVTDELRGVRDSPSKGGNAVRVATVIDAALLSYYDGDRSHGFWETTGNEGDRATAIE